MNTPATDREHIVDAALAFAADSHWENLRLYDVAANLGISLNDIRRHFREKEDLVEAWFDRADAAMLAVPETPGFHELTSTERIHKLIMAWLDALAPYRLVTRQMIVNKLEPGHLHVQIPGLLRVSRTVQWVREAAGRNATFVRRALEETALTSIYLATFAHWMADDSVGGQKTPRFLELRLRDAERLDHLVFRKRGRSEMPPPTETPRDEVAPATGKP
ncbi:MAG TPA: hypothetical protein PLN31_12180 [Azoarcus taiwanensis]|nr:hypothetical protein [Azoarcus taiwanensis]